MKISYPITVATIEALKARPAISRSHAPAWECIRNGADYEPVDAKQ